MWELRPHFLHGGRGGRGGRRTNRGPAVPRRAGQLVEPGGLSSSEVLLLCAGASATPDNNSGGAQGEEVVLGKRFEETEEGRVGLQMEEAPASTRDARGVSVLLSKELHLDDSEGPLKVAVPFKKNGSKIVVFDIVKVGVEHNGDGVLLYHAFSQCCPAWGWPTRMQQGNLRRGPGWAQY